jgi:hypothetical protein
MRLIKLKTPRARIPGSHGEKRVSSGIGSIDPLDESTNPSPSLLIVFPQNEVKIKTNFLFAMVVTGYLQNLIAKMCRRV